MTKIGINAHVPNSHDIQVLNELNPFWVRVDFNWYDLEPTKGNFQFSKFDALVSTLNTNIKIFPTLAYTPVWANGTGKNHPPTNVLDWTNFVEQCVNRYESRIKHWGIWNEPNLREFWDESRGIFINNILKPAYIIIKLINTDLIVVASDISTMGSSRWYDWFEDFASNQQYFDIFTYHVYGDTAKDVYKKIENGTCILKWFYPSKQPIKKYLDKINKPLWLTETGWDTNEYSETKQAKYYTDLINHINRKNYSDVTMFYELKDNANRKWGIIRSDYTKKKSFDSLKAFCDPVTIQ